jgi:hypothetical protein
MFCKLFSWKNNSHSLQPRKFLASGVWDQPKCAILWRQFFYWAKIGARILCLLFLCFKLSQNSSVAKTNLVPRAPRIAGSGNEIEPKPITSGFNPLFNLDPRVCLFAGYVVHNPRTGILWERDWIAAECSGLFCNLVPRLSPARRVVERAWVRGWLFWLNIFRLWTYDTAIGQNGQNDPLAAGDWFWLS